MKKLDIRNLKLLYVKLFAIAFLLPSYGGVGGGIYAQDPELFNHTWYLHYGILDGEEFTPLSYLQGELIFEIDVIAVNHPYCGEGFNTNILFDNQSFVLDFVEEFLIGFCYQPDEIEFMSKHYQIFVDILNTGESKNPFTYALEFDGDNYMLTIENGEGDIAVYGDVQLSVSDNNISQMHLYPNPVSDMLILSSNETVKEATVYDIHGKLIKIIRFNPENSVEIDVRHLQNGIYFLKIETESGRVATEKFIKK